jgi:hypothetical protein
MKWCVFTRPGNTPGNWIIPIKGERPKFNVHFEEEVCVLAFSHKNLSPVPEQRCTPIAAVQRTGKVSSAFPTVPPLSLRRLRPPVLRMGIRQTKAR